MEEIIFTIVTPCYNSEKYIESCIKSIMAQRFTNFEHIIVDGGSTDRTVDIIKKYVGKYNMRYISEKDNGMYDAINKGFKMANGRIFSWLNSDDMYFPWTLEEVNAVFSSEKIHWCNAREAYIDKRNRLYFHSKTVGVRAYKQDWIRKGYLDNRVLNAFIMQESSFWTRELWEKVGGVNPNLRLAGDYDLWKRMAKYEPLYVANTIWAAFRVSKNQLSANSEKYYSEIPEMSPWHKFLAKSKILLIFNMFFQPYNKKYLINMEDVLKKQDNKTKLRRNNK